MEQMFEDTIITMLFDSAYSKIVNHPEEIEKDGFEDIFETIALTSGGDPNETKATMLKVQAKEAAEEGYIKDINGSDEDNEEAVTAIFEANGIGMVFDITDKGKKYFLPLVKKQIKEKIEAVLIKLDEAIPTDLVKTEAICSCSGCGTCNK